MKPFDLETSIELLRRIAAGEAGAPAELLERYSRRLAGLVRRRLSRRLAAHVGAEDILQSTYRSFFHSAGRGAYTARRAGDLWRLLATIAVRKVFRQARRRQSTGDAGTTSVAGMDLAGSEPTPAEVAAARDEVERLLRILDDIGGQVLLLRLNGESTPDIARRLGCSDRTVRRKLAELRRRWDAPAPAAPKTDPQTLDYGDYLLHEYVGSGRTGRVYRATRASDGATVAVKFLRKRFQADARIVERFFQEMDVVQRLADPGVIAVHGRGRTKLGGCFLVLDYAAGGDLCRSGLIEQSTPPWIVATMRTVSETLARLHSRGVVHCDLKPANIVLDAAGAPRLTDFGVAKRIGEPAFAIDGTAPFLAPEQVSPRWGIIGSGADVYGLGATAFALLSGRPPWIGPSVEAILAQVESAVPAPSLREFAPSLPASLIAICDRCLRKSVRDRFPTAAALSAAFAAVEFDMHE